MVVRKIKPWLEAWDSQLHQPFLREGEGLEMELKIGHAFARSRHNTPAVWDSESLQVGTHIRTGRGTHPDSCTLDPPRPLWTHLSPWLFICILYRVLSQPGKHTYSPEFWEPF